MKTLALFIILSAASLFANDGQFVSKIIHETDSPVQINLSVHQWMKVSNFVQSGTAPGFVPTGQPGQDIGAVQLFQGAAGLTGIVALNASFATTTHAEHEDVFIAGPTVVFIAPVAGATLFFSYLIGKQ
jgi:hypothetical protein